MAALNIGYYVTTFLAALLFGGACYWLLNTPKAPSAWLYFWACGIIGLLTSVAFLFITQYYTESDYRPVRSIADASVTGPATNIIYGIAVGLRSVAALSAVNRLRENSKNPVSIFLFIAFSLNKCARFDFSCKILRNERKNETSSRLNHFPFSFPMMSKPK